MQNDRFTLGQDGRTGVYMNGQDLSAKHLIHWLEVDSKETRTTIYQATTIANYFTIAQDLRLFQTMCLGIPDRRAKSARFTFSLVWLVVSLLLCDDGGLVEAPCPWRQRCRCDGCCRDKPVCRPSLVVALFSAVWPS